MKVFISYSSKYRELVERLRLALVAEGHEPFVDRTELEPGQPFDAELREAIDDCDLFVYLVSPESVAPGSYALAELQLAQTRWPHPRGRELPVKLAPTPLADVPPYLKAVTMFEPQGDPVPGIVAAIARMTTGGRRWLWVAIALALLLVALAAGWWWRKHSEQAEARRQAVASAAELCLSGGHAAGWARLEQLAAQEAEAPLRAAREDCAMSWLREIRVRSDTESFTAIVNRVTPVLAEGLPGAPARRAADLRAHIGWGEALRAREGAADAQPDAHFKRALVDEADNAYANAMRAYYLAVHNREEEAVAHFRTAVAANRDRPFVRRMQLGAWLWRAGYIPHAVRAVDEMRRNDEPIRSEQRNGLWGPIYFSWLFNSDDDTRFLAILPASDHLATFEWLFPQPRNDGETAVWRYCRAVLRAHAGQREAAVAELIALRDELTARKQTGRVLDQTQRALKRLGAR